MSRLDPLKVKHNSRLITKKSHHISYQILFLLQLIFLGSDWPSGWWICGRRFVTSGCGGTCKHSRNKKKKTNKEIKVNVKKNAKTNLVGADILPASSPGNLSDITDRNTLILDVISSLEQSLPQGCSLDELMTCSVQQPGDLRSVGPEQDEGAIDNSSPVLGGLVSEVQDGFDSGGSSFAGGGENDC